MRNIFRDRNPQHTGQEAYNFFLATIFPDDELQKLTTFAAEGSYDDVEAESSAAAIRDRYQERGYFEVDVTWQRTRFPDADLERIIFTIDEGPILRVRERTFQVRPSGTAASSSATSPALS